MTFYYYYNPKQFIDPMWFGVSETDADPLKKKHHSNNYLQVEAEIIKEVIPSVLQSDAVTNSDEFRSNLGNFIGLSNQLKDISDKIDQFQTISKNTEELDQLKKEYETARQQAAMEVLEMYEEEEMVVLLLLQQ